MFEGSQAMLNPKGCLASAVISSISVGRAATCVEAGLKVAKGDHLLHLGP